MHVCICMYIIPQIQIFQFKKILFVQRDMHACGVASPVFEPRELHAPIKSNETVYLICCKNNSTKFQALYFKFSLIKSIQLNLCSSNI